jgi:hypothetical protein
LQLSKIPFASKSALGRSALAKLAIIKLYNYSERIKCTTSRLLNQEATMAGIFRDAQLTEQVADFCYTPNDSLAQLVVDAWTDPHFAQMLTNPDNAKALFAARGFYWNGTMKTPIVITEQQYEQGFVANDPDHSIVFVLPQHNGVCPPGQNLLDTAKLLMAATPNGI